MLTFWKTNLTHFEYKQDAGKKEDIEVGGMQENLQKTQKTQQIKNEKPNPERSS